MYSNIGFNNSKDSFALKDVDKDDNIVVIRTKKEQYDVVIEIIDNGVGIDNSIITKVYEPYFTTAHQSRGKGLGLFNTHKFITIDMHGSIDILNTKFTYNNTKQTGVKVILKIPLSDK